MPATFDLKQLQIAGDFFKSLEETAAELPFDLLPESPIEGGEAVEVGMFTLPKLGELVQGEEFIWNQFLDASDLDSTWMSTIQVIAVTLLLQFRYDPQWSVGKTLHLGQTQVKELWNFFTAERTGKQEPAVETEAEKSDEATPQKKAPKTPGRKDTGNSAVSSLPSPTLTSEPSPAAAAA